MRAQCASCQELRGRLLAISARSARLHVEMTNDAEAASVAQRAIAELEERISRTEPQLAEAADRLQLTEQAMKDFRGARRHNEELHCEEVEALRLLRAEATAAVAWRPETAPGSEAANLREALGRALCDLEDARADEASTAARAARDAAQGAAELVAAELAAGGAEDKRQRAELEAEIGDTRRRVSAGKAGLARLRALQQEAETRLVDERAAERESQSEFARRLAEQEHRACELEAENRALSRLRQVAAERNKAKVAVLRTKAKKYEAGLSNLQQLYSERLPCASSSRCSPIGGICVRAS